MELGSKEHKAQFYTDLLKDYFEGEWSDELFNEKQKDELGSKRQELAAIELKLERKEYKSKNEGEKAKFTAEREIAHLEQEIQRIEHKIKIYWPMRIERVKAYAKSQGIEVRYVEKDGTTN